MKPLKTIKYRGGIITFSIPRSWREDYDPEGGGMFYGEGPDSGTLRLNVVTVEVPPDSKELCASQVFSKYNDRQITVLPSGNAVVRYMQKAIEEGQLLHIHFWEVASPIPPRYIRLAIFSYTVLVSRASDAEIHKELELLDRLITEARFSPELGVSGEYPPT